MNGSIRARRVPGRPFFSWSPSSCPARMREYRLIWKGPMPAYVVVEIEVTDAVKYEKYKQLAPPSIRKYGGRYLVRGG
ncbi:MAG TPA: DUF1330 domain-containing protein, partial [Myxococcaceae bacterium]|nr:DUF1330 domain-containing protein [Myxococcaceae bacterium]